MPFQLPWLLVIGSAILYFGLGAIWYNFFGHSWLKALHKRKEQIDSSDPTPYLISFVGAVLNAIAIAIVLGWVAPLTETRLLAALVTTLLLGGAVFAAGAAKHYAFAGWSWKLYVIDLGYDLVGFFLMSLLIAFFR